MAAASGNPSDPFDLLGVPAEFEVDPARIERAWLRLAGQLHPDRVSNDEEAQALLAQINEARQSLLNPELRANVLLHRLGGPTKEQDRSLPEGFLAEMMEVRENAEDARQSGDTARWEGFQKWAGDRRMEHLTKVRQMFGAIRDGSDERVLKSIRTELNAWRYIERMLEQLEESRGVR